VTFARWKVTIHLNTTLQAWWLPSNGCKHGGCHQMVGRVAELMEVDRMDAEGDGALLVVGRDEFGLWLNIILCCFCHNASSPTQRFA